MEIGQWIKTYAVIIAQGLAYFLANMNGIR